MRQIRILVSGRVQGVSYRQFAKTWASNLNITGWCRNLEDGKVEIFAEGNKTDIDKFTEKLKEGSPLSNPTDIKLMPQQKISGFTSFVIKDNLL